jgi:hypothetical protein
MAAGRKDRDALALFAGELKAHRGGRGSARPLRHHRRPDQQGDRPRRHQPRRRAPPRQTSPASRAASEESSRCTGCDNAYAEDANTGYAGNGPQVMATGNITISLLHHAGVTEISRTLQAITRDRN